MTAPTATRIYASLGIVFLVILHAGLLRAPMPSYYESPAPKSFSFDSLESTIRSNPMPINATKRDEIKQDNASDSEEPREQTQTSTARPTANDGKCYLDLFVGSDPQSQSILRAFNTDPQLRKLRDKTHFQAYAANDELYKARYASYVPPSQFPAIVFTGPDGGHIYVASKESMPAESNLYSAMQEGFTKYQRARELAKQGSLAQDFSSSNNNPNCPDGRCRPFFPRNDPDVEGLFDKAPNSTDLITSFLRSSGVGLESLAVLAVAIVALMIVLAKR